MKRFAIYVALPAMLTAACATTPGVAPAASTAPPNPLTFERSVALCAQHESLSSLDAVLWQQTAVEYRAVTTQTYVAARRALDQALSDPSWNAMPELGTPAPGVAPAIALDLDETALDNSSYQARLVAHGASHSDADFKKFEEEEISRAVPGAAPFLQYAASRGVKVFYISNRLDVEAARHNLGALGFPLATDEETLLFKDSRPEWASSDKSSRREYVAKRYRLLMLLGDDFNDFIFAKGKTLAERSALFERYADRFGSTWFAIPNAEYGSWEAAITGAAKTPEEMCAAKLRQLRLDEAK